MQERSYSKLDPAPIRRTIELLHDRIRERFPESGLSRVAAELVAVAQQNEVVIVQVRRPVWWLPQLDEAEKQLRSELGEGDLLVTIGAGNVDELAVRLAGAGGPA